MDNTRNKKDRNLVSSVSEGKNMEILSLSLKKKKKKVTISSQVEKKNFRKEAHINVDFIRIIYHAFVFKQRLNHGIRCHQGF